MAKKESIALIKGDAIKELKKIKDDSIDFVLTDPPYNLGLFMKNRATNLSALRKNHFSGKEWDNLEINDWKENMEQLFFQLDRVLKEGGNLIVFMAVIKIETLINIAEKNNFYYKTTGIWHKKNPMPRNKDLHFINSNECWAYFVNNKKTGTFNNKGKTIHDFFETALTSSKEKGFGGHPTQKPLSLMDHLIQILSNKGDTILDPFMGSGSTGVSASRLGRNFIGIELNGDYVKIAKQRLKKSKQCQLDL